MQGSATCGSIEVTWEASRKDGGSPVTGYTIELRIGGETVKSKSLSNSSRATSFTNLKQKTQYEVRLNSNNALGDGEWRSISLNTTVACKEIRGNAKVPSTLIRKKAFLRPCYRSIISPTTFQNEARPLP